MKRNFYRLFLGSDPHEGHFAGLTPPAWHYPLEGARGAVGQMQRELWDWFSGKVQKLKPFDGAAWVGDMIDGDGSRSGGTELITTDRNEQIDMAVELVRFVGAKQNRFVYGTPYHTGQQEDFEAILATAFGAKISDQAWIEKFGTVIHLKHHIGGTSVPYGEATAVLKDIIWNILWNEIDAQPKAHIHIRGHRHSFVQCSKIGPEGRLRQGFVLPALQAAQTKFGGRRCSGTVNFGFVHIDLYPDGRILWEPHTLNVRSAIPEVEKW